MILLRESYRDGDKVKKRTLPNLSQRPAAKIEALRRVLRDEAVRAPDGGSTGSRRARSRRASR